MSLPEPLLEAIEALGRLPGIGPKSAQRIAFHLLVASPRESERLIRALTDLRTRMTWCETCFNASEGPACPICADPRRDASVICVVEEPRDVVAIERTREFRGLYHVLQGALDPIRGVGPDQIRARELVARLSQGTTAVEEVILGTNPNLEGEATALYLLKLLGPSGVKVTRIASGLPVGGDLEYADEVTLGRALAGRRRLSE